MNGRGRITAFERDKKRFRTLEAMVKRAGASNVTVKNQDFLTIDPLDPDYANVTHMFVSYTWSGEASDLVLAFSIRRAPGQAL